MMQFLPYLKLGIMGVGLSAGVALARPTFPVANPTTELESRYMQALLDTAGAPPVQAYDRLGLRAGSGVHTFYVRQHFQPRWTTATGWNQQAQDALRLLAAAPAYGLRRQDYNWSLLHGLTDSLGCTPVGAHAYMLATYELGLTDALLLLALQLRYGSLQPGTLLPRTYSAAATHQAVLALERAMQQPNFTPVFLRCQPTSSTYLQLLQAWQARLHASVTDSVALLTGSRQHEFQRVAINLERCRWYAKARPDSAFLLVNIPAYRLDVVSNGRVVRTHKVVVGKPNLPTPQFEARLYFFTTAPEWRVPPSIATQEILPQLRRDPGYLYRHQFHLYNQQGQSLNPYRIKWNTVSAENFPYTIRQRPGPDNSLGNVSFYMPNAHTVFLHDTPARKLFALSKRAYSHGCVRVENSVELAAFLLRRGGATAQARLLEQAAAGAWTERIRLPHYWPVQVRYFTCEATPSGQLRFYPDVYGLDVPLLAAFFPEMPVAAQLSKP